MTASALNPAETITGEDQRSETLACKLREHLQALAAMRLPITYGQAAKALQLSPPNTIRQLRVALQQLIAEDASAGRPLIAAMVISKWRGGVPAPDFFDCAARLGCFAGDVTGPDAKEFHAVELKAVLALWA